MNLTFHGRLKCLFLTIFVCYSFYSCDEDEVQLPVVATVSSNNISYKSAEIVSIISSDGGAKVTDRGVCWSTSSGPDIESADVISNDAVNGAITSKLAGLTPGTTYFVKAYARNSKGIAYGNEVSFTTLGAPRVRITTLPVTAVTTTSASLGGSITDDGGLPIKSRGLCWSTMSNPTLPGADQLTNGIGEGVFTNDVTSLASGTTYFVRAYAINEFDTVYGNEVSFKTITIFLPTLTTHAAVRTSPPGTANGTASTGGEITNDGNAPVIARGVCWSTDPNPTIALSTKTTDGTGIGSFTSAISQLTPDVTYYIRAYATNSAGTAYGNEVTFTNTSFVSITDVDGNTYKMITIGTQLWMQSNLKTTRYRDGSPIAADLTTAEWAAATTGAYAINRNGIFPDPVVNEQEYGKLYNYFAVSDPRKVCPQGTHVPSNQEWSTLIDYVGGTSVAGDKLKETGKTHWATIIGTNAGATDDFDFTALPGGWRTHDGDFMEMSISGVFWTADPSTYIGLILDNPAVLRTSFQGDAKAGYSVRCIGD